jgi:hypothetical protein
MYVRTLVQSPSIGVNEISSTLIEPVNLFLPQQEYASQHQLGHTLRMLDLDKINSIESPRQMHAGADAKNSTTDRVSQAKRGTPRPTEHLPFVDAQLDSDLLEIADGIVGGVVDQIRERRGLAAASLVDQNDAVRLGVKVSSHLYTLCETRVNSIMIAYPYRRIRSTSRTSVDKQHGLALGVTVLRHSNGVDVADFQLELVVRLNWRIERRVSKPAFPLILCLIP